MPMGSFITLVVLGTIGALIYIGLGGMPGRTARERGHPQADAISLLGWIGLLLGILPWLVAMVWARMQPLAVAHEPAPVAAGAENKGSEDDQEDS